MTKIEIYRYIANNNGITKRDMSAHFHCSLGSLIKPVFDLEQAGLIQSVAFQDGGEGCAFRRYKYIVRKK